MLHKKSEQRSRNKVFGVGFTVSTVSTTTVSLFIQEQTRVTVQFGNKKYYFAVFFRGMCPKERYLTKKSHNWIMHDDVIAQRISVDGYILWARHYCDWISDANFLKQLFQVCEQQKGQLIRPRPTSCCIIM